MTDVHDHIILHWSSPAYRFASRIAAWIFGSIPPELLRCLTSASKRLAAMTFAKPVTISAWLHPAPKRRVVVQAPELCCLSLTSGSLEDDPQYDFTPLCVFLVITYTWLCARGAPHLLVLVVASWLLDWASNQSIRDSACFLRRWRAGVPQSAAF